MGEAGREEVIEMQITKGTFAALAPAIPAVAAVATVVSYLVDWPYAGNHGLQLAIGLGVGVAGWLLAGVLTGDIVGVETASARTYEELRARVDALTAREADLRETPRAHVLSGQEALDQARRLVTGLRADLHLDAPQGDPRSAYRWVRGHGYVNAWRDVHQAEDVLLAVEPAEVVYATAATNLDRLGGTAAKSSAVVVKELTSLVGGDGDANGGAKAGTPVKARVSLSMQPLLEIFVAESRDGKSPEEEAVGRCDQDWGRALVRESAHRIHRQQNDAWDKIVNLRNRLLGALSLSLLLAYALVALIVLQPVDRTAAMTAAVAFFLVGAVVGVFGELYATSLRKKGTVFDYGLASARLAATPVLSGMAALGGVIVTNLAGSFLVEGGATASGGVPPLSDVFSLGHYPMGLVVAAIFGLTPGLLLARLKARTDDYEKQIADLAPSSQDGRTTADGDAP